MPERPTLFDRKFDRRKFMAALGAGAAVPAFAGQATASEHHDGGVVRPSFGYAALADEEPPVEPDHEIELLEREPEEEGQPEEYFFEPVGLYIEPCDTVQFTIDHDIHTVTSYHPVLGTVQHIPEDAAPGFPTASAGFSGGTM